MIANIKEEFSLDGNNLRVIPLSVHPGNRWIFDVLADRKNTSSLETCRVPKAFYFGVRNTLKKPCFRLKFLGYTVFGPLMGIFINFIIIPYYMEYNYL